MNSTIFSWYLFLYLTLKLCEEHKHHNKWITSGCSQRNNTPFNDVAQISDLSHREMGDIIVSELNFDIPKKKSSSPNVDLRCVSPIYFVLSSEWCFNWHSHHCDIAWSVGLNIFLNIFYAWKIRILYKYADLSCIIQHSWVSVALSASLGDLRVPWSNQWSYRRYILSNRLSFMSYLTIYVFFSWFHCLSFSMGHIWRNAFELLSAELQRVGWLF